MTEPNEERTRAMDEATVTQADREAAANFMDECAPYLGDCGMKNSIHLALVQALARHRSAASQASDAGPSMLVDQKWLERREAEPDAECEAGAPVRQHVMPGDPDNLGGIALQWYLKFEFGWPHSTRESNIAVEGFKDGFRAALATLTAPPTSDAGETLGRFGHHPDPATDFCIEVEELESIVTDLEKGMRESEDVPSQRIERAMSFRVGGDICSVGAKSHLRDLEERAKTLSPPTSGEEMRPQIIARINEAIGFSERGITVDVEKAADSILAALTKGAE